MTFCEVLFNLNSCQSLVLWWRTGLCSVAQKKQALTLGQAASKAASCNIALESLGEVYEILALTAGRRDALTAEKTSPLCSSF